MAAQLSGKTVLIAGATSESGRVATQTLRMAGADVVAVGHNPDKTAALAGPGVRTEVCDLTDEADVTALADRLHADGVHIDGILHLVGGWRGGRGLSGQTDADYRFLERSLTALRTISRAFEADLEASEAGRLAIVSSVAVAEPLAGGANYATVKAACETWTRAVGQGFEKAARTAHEGLRAASVVFRVKALDGLERALADRFTGLWGFEATEINGSVVTISA